MKAKRIIALLVSAVLLLTLFAGCKTDTETTTTGTVDYVAVDGRPALVWLANLSAIIGNLFRTGVCRSSDGMFLPNTPHTYPDSYLTMAKHRFRLSSALTEWQYPRCRLIFARHSLRPSCSRTE